MFFSWSIAVLDLTWCGAWLGKGGCGVAWWMGRLVVDRDSRPSGKGLFFLGTVDPVHWSQPSPGVLQTALEWPARTGLSPWTPWPHQLFIRTPGWFLGTAPRPDLERRLQCIPRGCAALGVSGRGGRAAICPDSGSWGQWGECQTCSFPVGPSSGQGASASVPSHRARGAVFLADIWGSEGSESSPQAESLSC